MQFPVQQFPILTPEQMSPFNAAISQGLKNYTDYAGARSKLTYADLMGPQFLAKLYGNQDFVANVPNEKRQTDVQNLRTAATAPTGVQGLFNRQQPGFLTQFANWIFGGGQQAPNAAQGQTQAPQATQTTPQTAQGQPKPLMPTGNGPLPTNFGSNNRASDQEVEQISQQAAANAGQTPTQAPQQAPQQFPTSKETVNDYFKNAAEANRIKALGTESGKLAANQIDNFSNDYQRGVQLNDVYTNLSGTLTNPEFENMRKVPIAGRYELGYFAKHGNRAQQQLAGGFIADTNKIIAESSNTFKGQFRQGEQQLLEQMKINEKDTVDSAKGKLQSLMLYNSILTERSQLSAELMRTKNLDKDQAIKEANKQLNVPYIKMQIHDRLNPYITLRDKDTGATKTVTAAEARRMGVKLNG